MRKNITSLLAGIGLTALSLVGCYPFSYVEKAEDLTGDGKTDVILKMSGTIYCGETKFLFVQEEDGSFKGYERQIINDSNFGNTYFFDGEIYRKAMNPNSPEKK